MGCPNTGDGELCHHKATATLNPVQGLENRSSLAEIR